MECCDYTLYLLRTWTLGEGGRVTVFVVNQGEIGLRRGTFFSSTVFDAPTPYAPPPHMRVLVPTPLIPSLILTSRTHNVPFWDKISMDMECFARR